VREVIARIVDGARRHVRVEAISTELGRMDGVNAIERHRCVAALARSE
jgi:hypothetical protein